MTDYNWNDAPDWATCVIQNKGAESQVYWASNLCAGATIQWIPDSEMPVCKSVLSTHAVDDFVIVEFKPPAYAAPYGVDTVLAKLREEAKTKCRLRTEYDECKVRIAELTKALNGFGVAVTDEFWKEHGL